METYIFDYDPYKNAIWGKRIPMTRDQLRGAVYAANYEVYIYEMPLKERRGSYYIVYCPANTDTENKKIATLMQEVQLPWQEIIYGKALLLYAKHHAPGERVPYESITYRHTNDLYPYIRQHLDRAACKTRSMHYRDVDLPVGWETQYTRGPDMTPAFTPGPIPSAPPATSPATSSVTSPAPYLLQMAAKGLLSDKTTCPITLEPLTSTIWMFPCGHGCSPQTVQLQQCPICRHTAAYVPISV